MIINNEVKLKSNSDSDIIRLSSNDFSNENTDLDHLYTNINNSAMDIDYYRRSWCYKDGSYYFYKSDFAFYELLLKELFEEFNLKCVDFLLASYQNNLGVMSKNFRRNDTFYYTYDTFIKNHFNVSSIRHIYLDDFDTLLSQIVGNKNRIEIVNSLSRLLAIDFFTGQMDRGKYNIIFEKKDGFISLAPFTDNGSSFRNIYPQHIHSCLGDLNFPSSTTVVSEEYNTLLLIIKNKEFRDCLIRCLDIDMEEIIKRTLDKYNIYISDEEKTFIMDYIDKKKSVIDSSLKLIRKKED